MALDIAQYFPRSPWDHQLQGLTDALNVLRHRASVVMCAPCGAGKSTMISALLRMAQANRKRAIVYNFRKLLVTQMSETLDGHGVGFGVRSAAHKHLKDLSANIQVASIFTDMKRVAAQGCWDYHEADLVIVDEAHMGRGEGAANLIQHYLGQGSKVIAVTATPASLAHMYSELVIAGTKKQLRKCKAHVRARVFGPHQMDLQKVKRVKTGEFDMGGVRKHAWNQAVVGYLYKDWLQYNPDGRQTLHFTPGVAESKWAAEDFWQKGVPSGHMDAKGCWYNGKSYSASSKDTIRSDMLDMWDAGEIVHLSNHSVLKEGIDRPSVYCLMISRPIGDVCTYDQITGRLIRYSEATPDEVVMLDFAGNYDRHGSPNSDRDWHALFNLSPEEIVKEERERQQNAPDEAEPITCTGCGMKRLTGDVCPNCGAEFSGRTRMIIEAGGNLREEVGRMYAQPPPPKPQKSKEQKQWDSIFWRCRNSRRPITFAGAASIYEKSYGERPPQHLRGLPKDKAGWSVMLHECNWRNLT